MDDVIKKFVDCRELAVVGVSSSKVKFGRSVFRTLRQRGIKVFAITPSMSECDGVGCFSSLRKLPKPVEAAVVVVKPAHAMAVVEDAAAAGVKRLWFQQGADFAEAARVARERGIETVTGKCILMYAGEVTGIHRVHRFIDRIIGRY